LFPAEALDVAVQPGALVHIPPVGEVGMEIDDGYVRHLAQSRHSFVRQKSPASAAGAKHPVVVAPPAGSSLPTVGRISSPWQAGGAKMPGRIGTGGGEENSNILRPTAVWRRRVERTANRWAKTSYPARRPW